MEEKNIYKRSLFILIVAILIFAPIARGAVKVWSITPILMAGLAVMTVWLWKMNNSAGYILKKTPLDLPLVMFIMLAASSFAFSIYKHDSLYVLLQLAGCAGIFYVVINEFDEGMEQKVALVIAGTGAALSFCGLLQYFGLLGSSWWADAKLLSATYVNHNHFSGYLELAIPVTIGILIASNDSGVRRAKLLLLPGLVIMFAAFILAQSRGAWASLAISFLIVGPVFLRKRNMNAKNILVIILIILALASLFYFGRDIISNRVDTAPIFEGEEMSLVTRVKIWQGSLDIIRHYPLTGVGIGNFVWAFPIFRPAGLNVQTSFAHNDYLQIASETGILSLLVFAWLLIILVKTSVKNGSFDPVKAGCAVGLMSLSLHGLVDFNFHIPANVILFTVCAAIAIKSADKNPKGEKDA